MGYGGRTLGGYTHKEDKSSIPATARFWWDEDGEDSPVHGLFSLIKSTVLAAAKQQYTAPAYSPVIIAAAPESVSGASAVSIATHSTNATSTGVADALTLADGTIVGQLKMLTHVADGGSLVLTPATFVDGATVTFTTAGERWVGMWLAAGWQTVELSNVADGGAVLPAIA
jgi:hypothetical protein